MAACNARFITHSAIVWGFIGVSSHVPCQIVASRECFIAHSALVWGFLGVSSHVPCQIAVFNERFVAHSALIFVEMDFQVLLGCVWFIADS